MSVDLSPHIKDLITASSTMPQTDRRKRITELLQNAYLLETSEGLQQAREHKTDADPVQASRAIRQAQDQPSNNRKGDS